MGHGYNNYFDVMSHCMSLAAYTVHINSHQEHEDIKQRIREYAGNVMIGSNNR